MLLESCCNSKWNTASDFQGVHHFSCVRANPQGGCGEAGVFFQMPSPTPASPASIGTQKVYSDTNRQHSNAELHWCQFMGFFKKPMHALRITNTSYLPKCPQIKGLGLQSPVESPSHPSPKAHTTVSSSSHAISKHLRMMFDIFNWPCVSMTVLQAPGIPVRHAAASNISTCPQASHQSLTKCIPSFNSRYSPAQTSKHKENAQKINHLNIL